MVPLPDTSHPSTSCTLTVQNHDVSRATLHRHGHVLLQRALPLGQRVQRRSRVERSTQSLDEAESTTMEAAIGVEHDGSKVHPTLLGHSLVVIVLHRLDRKSVV